MAEIVGGVGTSHIPAVGAAVDKGKTGDAYWKPYFDKLPPRASGSPRSILTCASSSTTTTPTCSRWS